MAGLGITLPRQGGVTVENKDPLQFALIFAQTSINAAKAESLEEKVEEAFSLVDLVRRYVTCDDDHEDDDGSGICMHTYHTYIHTYMHTYMYVCIHTYIHTYIPM